MRKTPTGAGRSTTPHNRTTVTDSAVSSAISRRTAASSASPGSTLPPGTDHCPRPGSLARNTSNSLPRPSRTRPPTHLIAGRSTMVMSTHRNRIPTREPAVTPERYRSFWFARSAVHTLRTGTTRMYERNWRTGSINVNLKKLLTWAAVALVLFFLISAPQQASGLVTHILDLLKNGATAIVTFVKTLVA